MSLTRLSVHFLRNLQSVDISPSPGINLIYGENGSGKTSLLEAIHVLGLAKSFRSHKHKSLISYQQSAFTVFGKVLDEGREVMLGVNRQLEGDPLLKADGSPVGSAAALAHYLPLQVINADTFLLLEGSPSIRRQFMDWLVFHVEPSFFPLWKDLQRCLKHRNSLLRRDRIDGFELAPWDQELVQLTDKIHQLRDISMARFFETFFQLAQEFITLKGLAISYFRGWDKNTNYSEALSKSFERDRRMGFTQLGSHRADLRITLNGQNAADLLSRGQQKLLVCALKIAQGVVFQQLTGRRCIYLVDDLPAELDEQHRQRLVDWLHTMQTQVFITGVEPDLLLSSWRDKPGLSLKMFHVEQGKVTEAGDLYQPQQ